MQNSTVGLDATYYRHSLEYALGIPFSDHNQIEILQNGAEIFPSMLAAIRAAEESIDFVTFVYWGGNIAREYADALADKAREGVVVRVLLDSFGARRMASELTAVMELAGVQVRWFRPLSTWRIWRADKRTHRKLLVCDHRVAFTGGVGIAEEWEGNASGPQEWRETHVRVEGPAVRGLRAAFLDNWNEAGPWLYEPFPGSRSAEPGSVPIQVVRAASTLGWTDMACLLRTLIAISRTRLRIVTAYFVPDRLLTDLLADAVTRGVQVELLVPGRYTDSRLSQLAGHESIERLLQAGVSIWRYRKTLLHAKIVTVDALVRCVGSANLNHRSMGKDEECCVVWLSETQTRKLDDRFDADCRDAEELCYEKWHRRGGLLRAKERLAKALIEHL